MKYVEIFPPADLAPFVECIWMVAYEAGANSPVERIVPDGCMELIFHLGALFHRGMGAQKLELQASANLVGQSSSPLFLKVGGQVDTVGVRFKPAGALPFFQLPMFELTDLSVPLWTLWPKALTDELVSRLGEAESDEARVAVVCQTLRRRFKNSSKTAELAPLVGLIGRSSGLIRVSTLAEAYGKSARQLERTFRTTVGLTPKHLARIFRLQTLLKLLPRDGTVDWAGLAIDAGYFDQSHLTHDFGELAGLPPQSFVDLAGPFARQFIRPKRLERLLGS